MCKRPVSSKDHATHLGTHLHFHGFLPIGIHHGLGLLQVHALIRRCQGPGRCGHRSGHGGLARYGLEAGRLWWETWGEPPFIPESYSQRW